MTALLTAVMVTVAIQAALSGKWVVEPRAQQCLGGAGASGQGGGCGDGGGAKVVCGDALTIDMSGTRATRDGATIVIRSSFGTATSTSERTQVLSLSTLGHLVVETESAMNGFKSQAQRIVYARRNLFAPHQSSDFQMSRFQVSR
jgi:hypothetical protein